METFLPYWQYAAGQLAAHSLATIIAAVAFLLLAGFRLLRSLRPWQSYLRSKPILTANEKEFFYRLQRALPTYHVFPQVAFSALITLDPQLGGKHQFSIRRRYGWKIADFVICKPDTFAVLAIVELDDRTHNASADRKRDALMRAAGYQTLRFQSKHKPTVTEITDLFARLAPLHS
jgi:hypothetical protein